MLELIKPLRNLTKPRDGGPISTGARVYTLDPSTLTGLKAWYKFNTGITVTGSGVSQWDDQSGNGNHLLQTTDSHRPSKEADGSILFDGTTNEHLDAAFTFTGTTVTRYILFKSLTWTWNQYILDGYSINSMVLQQYGTTPQILTGSDTARTGNLALGTYGVICDSRYAFRAALLQLNNEAPALGSVGNPNLNGLSLGAKSSGLNDSYIQVKEVLAYSEAHDASTRAMVINYLNTVDGGGYF